MVMQKKSSNKKLYLKQYELIKILEGLGDILVFETKRRKNEIVKKV